MENLIRRYEKQKNRLQNAINEMNNLYTNLNEARKNFMKKYRIRARNEHNWFLFEYLPLHPELKPYFTKHQRAQRIRKLEENRLMNLQRQLRRSLYIPPGRRENLPWFDSVLENAIRRYRNVNKIKVSTLKSINKLPKNMKIKIMSHVLP
jgi:hypothetical protein